MRYLELNEILLTSVIFIIVIALVIIGCVAAGDLLNRSGFDNCITKGIDKAECFNTFYKKQNGK